MGLLLSSKTITDPSLNRDTRGTSQVPWHLDLQNLINHCPGGYCDDNTPIGLLQGNFQNNYKECPGGRCDITSINALQGTNHNRDKNLLSQGNLFNREERCKGKHCGNVTPIGFIPGRSQNKDKGRCTGRWCDVTSNSPFLQTFQNLNRCPGGRCEATTEGPTLGGFQGTADPFEDYFVTENTLSYDTDSRVTDPIIFSETNTFSNNNFKEDIQNSFPNNGVATFAPSFGEVPSSVNSIGSVGPPPGRIVTVVPSTPSIAPSRGFVYVDFGEDQNSYGGGGGSISVVSQEIDNSRFQRESTIVDNDYDFWNSINGILGNELRFPNSIIHNQQSNNNINKKPARKINSSNAAALIKEPREARSFTSHPSGSVGAPSRGFITVDFGGDPEDWGPGGFIRVVSHE